MSDPVAAYLDDLWSLCDKTRRDGPSTLAHLRRGLTDPVHALSRVGWLFRRFADERDLDTAIIIGGLFALARGQCQHGDQRNLGQAYASYREHSERRFIDLLDTDAAELPYKLRQIIAMLAQKSVPLDWIRLFQDVKRWSHADRTVQKRWARGFWSPPADESDSEPPMEN